MDDSTKMEDTMTPIHLQVVVKLSFKYDEENRKSSHVFLRVNAFSSRACIDKSYDTLTLGTPVVGVLDLTDSTYKSAQLIGFL